jgi:hypothetical protein
MPTTSSPIATSRLKRVILAPLAVPPLPALAVPLLLALAMSTMTAKANAAPATAATAGTAATARIADPAGYTRIQVRHSDQCLDIAGASPIPGATLHQHPCHLGANQQFSSAANGGAFSLAPGAAPSSIWVRHSAQVLDNGSSFARSSPIMQSPFRGSLHQQWVFLPVGENWFLIHNMSSGQCIDIKDGSRRVGARANQFPCHGRANQQFRFIDQ